MQKSNSRVLHMAHSKLTALFPAMLAPTADSAATGLPGNQAAREAVLEQTCYQCHPGTNTKCMRGARPTAAWSVRTVTVNWPRSVTTSPPMSVPPSPSRPVPISSSACPGPTSPAAGLATRGMPSATWLPAAGTAVNGYDTNGNADCIRLIRAYLDTDANAKPIVPTNKRFAENTIPASFNGFANPGAGNQKLYRVSTGHGGVMCEGCHGATHAEWPNADPNANDNVAANQLQGHAGAISECSTCHTTSAMSASTQGGPARHAPGQRQPLLRRRCPQGHWPRARTASRVAGTCGACHGAEPPRYRAVARPG